MTSKVRQSAYIVVEGRQRGVFTNYADVEKSTDEYNGQIMWKLDTFGEAEEAYQAILNWRALSPENRSKKLLRGEAKEIIRRMLDDSEGYINECLSNNNHHLPIVDIEHI
ncbi:viroplasmin family protein [Vibrio splendidus]